MLVAMAGLPGTGKSTLARALAPRLSGVVLDKDHLRAQVFPPSYVDYSWEQDDFCVELLCRTAGWLLDRDSTTVVLLDGCTFTRPEQVDLLHRLRVEHDDFSLVECSCPDSVALDRLQRDQSDGTHVARNRSAELYRSLQDEAAPVPEPKLVLDTARPVEQCVQQCLEHLSLPDSHLRRTPC